MEKIQLATRPAAYGARLAEVDHVLMGAGTPSEIPGMLDALSTHSATELTVAVEDSNERHTTRFDPTVLIGVADGAQRPLGLAHRVPVQGRAAARIPVRGEGLEKRTRLCDLGYLRTPFRKGNGTVGYRCPAEPVDASVRKGGEAEATADLRCLCNALTANVGLHQQRSDDLLDERAERFKRGVMGSGPQDI